MDDFFVVLSVAFIKETLLFVFLSTLTFHTQKVTSLMLLSTGEHQVGGGGPRRCDTRRAGLRVASKRVTESNCFVWPCKQQHSIKIVDYDIKNKLKQPCLSYYVTRHVPIKPPTPSQ